jgi:hypothetical protein
MPVTACRHRAGTAPGTTAAVVATPRRRLSRGRAPPSPRRPHIGRVTGGQRVPPVASDTGEIGIGDPTRPARRRAECPDPDRRVRAGMELMAATERWDCACAQATARFTFGCRCVVGHVRTALPLSSHKEHKGSGGRLSPVVAAAGTMVAVRARRRLIWLDFVGGRRGGEAGAGGGPGWFAAGWLH